jgi:hypothetical protein
MNKAFDQLPPIRVVFADGLVFEVLWDGGELMRDYESCGSAAAQCIVYGSEETSPGNHAGNGWRKRALYKATQKHLRGDSKWDRKNVR